MFIVMWKKEAIPSNAPKSGLMEWSKVAASGHYPYVDGNIYSTWATSVRKDAIGPFNTAANIPMIMEQWSFTNDWGIKQNGTNLFTTSTNTVSIRDGTSGVFCSTGDNPQNTIGLYGYLAELMVWDTKLSSGDRTLVYNYLHGKWNI
jgi:hypothetical protein